ncbi:MAG: hypothetical protein HYY13_01450 [Nitrospirae bacterium]|nr:hypothetical protein [Nitrospirota bacterium]
MGFLLILWGIFCLARAIDKYERWRWQRDIELYDELYRRSTYYIDKQYVDKQLNITIGESTSSRELPP